MTILNQRDYRTAKARAAQLAQATGHGAIIERLQSNLPSEVSDTRHQTLKGELGRLEAEIAEYERLQRGAEPAIGVEHAEDLGMLPILGRIARQLSQRELADLLELKEQQIQRYEAQRYAGISLARYEKILQALGVELHAQMATAPLASSSMNQMAVSPEIPAALARELRRRSWGAELQASQRGGFEARVSEYLATSSRLTTGQAFNRRTEGKGSDGPALEIWRARVLQVAAQSRSRLKGRFNIADTSWLHELIALSILPDGPLRAAELLREHGIILVVEKHFSSTRLDGGAFLLIGKIPVVGMTLRIDRVDNFWFTLFHELGHIYLHFNQNLDSGYLDELDGDGSDQVEREADGFARSRLVPDELWAVSAARFATSSAPIKSFASSIGIHPAIIAGKIQRERRNYKVFQDLLGRGQVRDLFFERES